MLSQLASSRPLRLAGRQRLAVSRYYASAALARAPVYDEYLDSIQDVSVPAQSTSTRQDTILDAILEEAKTPATVVNVKKARAPRKKATKVREPRVVNTVPLKPLEESQSYQHFLAYQNSRATTPALDISRDIDDFRTTDVPHRHAKTYVKQYEGVRTRLDSCFSKEQLRSYCESNGVSHIIWGASTTRKPELLDAVMVHVWGWTSLPALAKELAELKEIIPRTFPLDTAQAFLVMGKDGSDVFRLSKEYDVALTLVNTPKGLTMEARGVRKALNAFAEHVRTSRESTIVKTFTLPTSQGVPASLLTRISRLSNAFVERAPSSSDSDAAFAIRIHAKSEREVEAAKRLALESIILTSDSSKTEVLSYMAPLIQPKTPIPFRVKPHKYSLYPFLSAKSQPWNMSTGGAFRIRRVSEWLAADTYERINETGGMAGTEGRITDLKDQILDLRENLLGGVSLEGSDAGQPTISATFGHLLFTPASETSSALVPPLLGARPLSGVLHWVEENQSQLHFVPSLPNPAIKASGIPARHLQRVVYRTMATEEAFGRTSYRRLVLEVPMQGEQHEEYSDLDTILRVKCSAGLHRKIDVLTPDRPMDVRFTVDHSLELAQLPPALADHVDTLNAWSTDPDRSATSAPLPPLSLEVDGIAYHLECNAAVKQATEAVSVAMGDEDEIFIPVAYRHPRVNVPIIKESATESESKFKSSTCSVKCNSSSDEDWTEFLQRCDKLSASPFAPAQGYAPLFDDADFGARV